MKKKTILILINLLIFSSLFSQEVIYNVNKTFNNNTDVIIFPEQTFSYGIFIDAEYTLNSDDGFIKVILETNDSIEYLIFECNNLYSTENSNQFVNGAFETCILDNANLKKIKIKLYQSSMHIFCIKNKVNPYTNENRSKIIEDKKNQIVNNINEKLELHKKAWRAGMTILSEKSYNEQKVFFHGDNESFPGIEYYAYGYYSPLNDSTPQASNEIIKDFSWIDRHGANLNISPYYNSVGYGWIPPRRQQQGHKECWAFSCKYALEAIVNLYYNQQLNKELSVQDIISCSNGGTWDEGGYPKVALNYIKNVGIVNEDCFPFTPCYQAPCTDKCNNPDEIISIEDFSNKINGEVSVKEALINKGPLVGIIGPWGHAMNLVGYGVVKSGDLILDGNESYTNTEIYVEEDSPDIGKPYYIFEQSYGIWGYDKTPFFQVITNNPNAYYIDTPINSLEHDVDDIACNDFDGDGYYFWGIGEKPPTCPDCPDEPDSDDFNALIGPLDENYNPILLCDNNFNIKDTLKINKYTVWNTKKYIPYDILIDSGKTLIINDTVLMGPNTKIIVKPSAKLIIDKGFISNICPDNMWQGIQVWGNSDAPQTLVNGQYKQGYIELKNGATIENAICAVDLWKPDNYNLTGGIIHANDAIFRNNKCSVHALLYYNKPNGDNEKISDYNGYFNNCTFELNNDYIGTEIFHKHIDLSSVKGISFTGCDFINNCTDYDKISYWNVAVALYNASANIKGKTPQYETTNCTDSTNFIGFYSGITSVNDLSSPASLVVKHANFTNNAFGIKMSNNSIATILFSKFLIGKLWDCGSGIYAKSTNNFKIEENHFSKFTPIPKVNFFGIIIDDSKGVNNIYRNTFKGLTCGNFAKNKNWVDNNTFEGLEYTCNNNINNNCDFYVEDNQTGTSGIQAFQGDENKPAGNTFSNARTTWHFYNGGNHLVEYFYNRNSRIETPNSNLINEKVIITPTDSCNECLSNYVFINDDDDILRGEERLAKEQEYIDAYTNYTNVKTLYNESVDGGDTEGEIRDIKTAQPEDMWQLRTQLLGHSPHLSQEVLIEASDRSDVFTESVLFEILSANPDELKRDSLINYLENKEDPLPDYMIEVLKQVATGTTAKTAMQKQMSKYKLEYSQAAGDIIRSILNDTILNLTDLRNWLDNLGGLNSDRQIISTYIYENDYDNAISLANMLPSLYNLSGRELTEHNQYMQILNLYNTLYSSNRTIYDLDSTEKATIIDLADNGIGVAQSMAQAIMIGVYNSTDYCDNCPTITEERGKSYAEQINPKNMSEALGLYISAKPNPANSWTAFDYKLPESKTNAIITITNMMGKVVDKIDIYDQQGQILWDTRNVPSGVYIYTIKCDNLVLSDKIVIKK